MKNRPVANFHVETRVLGSAFGDGRFLETKDVVPFPLLSLEPASRPIADNMDTNDTRRSQSFRNIGRVDNQEP